MKKLSKFMSVMLTAVLVFSLVPVMTSFAASTGGTEADYVWVPKVVNVDKMNFSEYLNADDVTVTKNTENNSVTLTFTPDEADVEARTQTEVRLDTAAVPGYNHYVSFDITMDAFAEFVATMDLEANDGMRPYSFYIGSESWSNGDGSTTTVNRVAALQHDPDTHYIKDGALNTNEKNWWKGTSAGGMTWDANAMKKSPINVKLLNKSKYMAKNANAEQIVYVYINGKCVGQTQTGSTATANQFFNFDTLRLIHYATKAETQNITLANIQMGYVYENEGYCVTLNKDPNLREEVFLPEGNKVYVKYTLPTTSDVSWDISAGSLTGSPAAGLSAPGSKNWVTPKWTGTFGMIADSYLDKGNTHLKGFDDSTGIPVTSDDWWKSNVQFWGPADGTAEIAIIVDRVNGTYTVERSGYPYAKQTTNYVEFMDWCKAPSGQKIQFRHAAPTYTDLATQGVTTITNYQWNTAGFAKAIEVGEVIERDLKVTKVTGADGVAKVSATGFGNTDNANVDVIVAQRDADGNLIKADVAKVKVENGVWWLNNKTDMASNTNSATVYVWEDMKNNLEPICKSETILAQ